MAAGRRQPRVVSRQTGPPTPVDLRLRDGRRRTRRFGADAHAALLSELLHADRPGLVEVVGARRRGDGSLGDFDRSQPANFVASGDRDALLQRVRALRSGRRREVFLTPATLQFPLAGRESVAESAVLWVDIDDPRRLPRLDGFPHRPHAVIASGSGGVHAYWRLAEPLQADCCDRANRKLAAALGADMQSCDRGRIMRVPGTQNWKHAAVGEPGAWCGFLTCDLSRPAYNADVLTAGLRDPKEAPARRSRLTLGWRSGGLEPWKEMAPADYYRVITGAEPRRDGKVRCPNLGHADRHPSAQLYSEPGSGWFCFSCGAGGGAADMVAARRGWPTGRALRGEQFVECVKELRRLFGVAEPERARGRRRS